MAFNNNYFYTTIISITSILENANSNTKYDFYIMHTSDLSYDKNQKFKNLEKKYKKCSINLLNMTNFKFNKAKLSGHIKTIATYYRIYLPDLLPNINKFIYFDGITLTFTELKEMYDIDIENFFIIKVLEILLIILW